VKVWLVAALVLSLSVASNAAAKRELRGFFPGMSKEEVTEKGKAAGCSYAPSAGCKVDDGELNFNFTKTLSPPLVREVVFRFKSGTQPAEMISQISSQFGVRPVKSNQQQDIIRAMGCKICYAIDRSGKVGGVLARWQLGNGLSLQLDLRDYTGVGRIEIADYALFLTSQKVEAADKQAEQQARDVDAAKFRKVNPVPKF